MELIGQDKCPFDWDCAEDAAPETLSGGRVVATRDNTYCYGYFDGGEFTGALFLPKRHILVTAFLMGPTWAEVGSLYAEARKEFGLVGRSNLSINDGYLAGQRFGHAHAHCLRRLPGLPSSTIGFKTNLDRFDGLVGGLREALGKATK